MKRSLLPLFLVISSSSFAQDPVVQTIINDLSIDSIIWNLQRLSGEQPVDVGAGGQIIASRHKLNAGNTLAADWLQQRLTDYGYTPTVQTFSGGTGENVLAEKIGSVHPDRKVIICGHYDAMPPPPLNAPAADDDGSGTVAVLEAARLFADHTFENTVVFALWDEEEQGKVGSIFYAGAAAANDDSIVAVINVDAIAFDGDGDDLMRIHAKNVSTGIALKDSAVMVNTQYAIGLSIAINLPGAVYSDHASFWNEGYPAILIIEDFDNDGNPHYHTPTDLITYLDQAYFEQLARLALGTTAVMAVPVASGTAITNTPVAQRAEPRAWPVPASDQVTISFDRRSTRAIAIKVFDAMGRDVTASLPNLSFPANGTVRLDLSRLPAGAYRAIVNDAEGLIGTVGFIRTP